VVWVRGVSWSVWVLLNKMSRGSITSWVFLFIISHEYYSTSTLEDNTSNILRYCEPTKLLIDSALFGLFFNFVSGHTLGLFFSFVSVHYMHVNYLSCLLKNRWILEIYLKATSEIRGKLHLMIQPGLTNSVNFIEICWNLMDSVPTEFQNRRFYCS
jgi:hypothetical protein